ncbi:EI24 domain-containing protein [Campylobacter sp. 9BO]|uniref:EI24 domain-containing protein n=1 Tax=Campylobacter sp. 9BO TaxID=3424759 RepID=UPI003D34DA9A
MQIYNLFLLSLRDFWTKKFIMISILPLICSVIVLGVGFFWASSEFKDVLSQAFNSGDFGFFDLSAYPMIMSVISHGAVSWVLSATLYALGTYFMLMLSIVVALGIAGFLTPVVASEVNDRHYRAKFTPISTAKSLRLMGVVGFKFLGLLVICLPFMFVPVINFIAINVPFFYIYAKLLLIDVGSNTISEAKFKLLWLDNGGFKFMFFAFCFYIISLVPLLGLLFQLFFITFLSHLFFQVEAATRF